jgi:hypothetical protein
MRFPRKIYELFVDGSLPGLIACYLDFREPRLDEAQDFISFCGIRPLKCATNFVADTIRIAKHAQP